MPFKYKPPIDRREPSQDPEMVHPQTNPCSPPTTPPTARAQDGWRRNAFCCFMHPAADSASSTNPPTAPTTIRPGALPSSPLTPSSNGQAARWMVAQRFPFFHASCCYGSNLQSRKLRENGAKRKKEF